MLESEFQANLVKELKTRFKGAMVLKNDEQYLQGIPDLTLLYRDRWAFLEVKKSLTEPYRPNQEYYIGKANTMSIGLMICPENKREMIDHIANEWGVS